ncbi:hypothetical protein SKAU_G00343700 [Synaphobranchus kaupii]|uniref:G-protein coupled receptors family 1 profile domain-containing protein n=1 Tax=Synaphobranchus kaupii TaxID=118154 RepID=A0A9Q1IH95_SYNKA|nr:hypothetical protein SKAU_G00343700 [Synaphobranchus kaupii]
MPLWEDFNSSVNDVRYFVIGLYTTVSVLGLLGNILILTALARKWREKSVINFLCVSVVVSTLVLMSIAMVRYHMISRPLSAHMSVSSGYRLLVAIWTLGLSVCSPLPIFHSMVDLSEVSRLESLKNKWLCVESWPSDGYRIAFTIGLLLVQYILPVLCLTVSHATVCRRVRTGALAQPPGQAEENEAIRLTLQPATERGFLPRRSSPPTRGGAWAERETEAAVQPEGVRGGTSRLSRPGVPGLRRRGGRRQKATDTPQVPRVYSYPTSPSASS